MKNLKTKLTENKFKICGRCRKKKPITEYWKHSSGGTQNICKECMRKAQQDRKGRERPREPGKGEYRCNRCDEIMPEKDFYVTKNKKYGPTISSYCRKCTVKINLESQKRRRGEGDEKTEGRLSIKSKLASFPDNYPIWE